MEYHTLEKLIDLYDGYRRVFKIDAHSMLLLQESGQRFLLESHCPHRGAPLLDAAMESLSLTCPRHGYRFDISSGEVLKQTEEPCRMLRRYELVEREREVGVMI